MSYDNRRNSEGYSDPTAYAALSKIEKEERELMQLKRVIGEVCALSGFRLKGQIILVDKKSGRSYRV